MLQTTDNSEHVNDQLYNITTMHVPPRSNGFAFYTLISL